MVWVGQVKVGRLSNGILLNIDNIPSAPGPVQECILSMICVTEWSPLLHSLKNDL